MRKHILYFTCFLYMFRENWCESLWRVASVRILFILLIVFDDFGELHSSLLLYNFVAVLWKCIWPLLADVKCSFLVCFTMFFYEFGVLEGPTEAYSVLYISFIDVSRQLMREFCGGLPMFEFCLCYCVFLMISVNVTIH